MGQELHRRFAFVDASAPARPTSRSRRCSRRSTPARRRRACAVVVYRERGRTVATGPAPLVRDLDALPLPDFDDYFAIADRAPLAGSVAPVLLLETGRGCWWGAKSHCTFCGLNGGSMAFRTKGAGRALDEIRQLRERYGIALFYAVDNILDMRLLPQPAAAARGRAARGRRSSTRSRRTCRPSRSRCCGGGRDGGAARHREPSDHVLKLMGKGTSALQNVRC